MRVQAMSCRVWNTMSGNTMSATLCPANSTVAIGTLTHACAYEVELPPCSGRLLKFDYSGLS